MVEVVERVFLDDTLGRDGCTNRSECRDLVGNFRMATARLRRQKALYVAFTPSELAAVPAQQIHNHTFALGAIDLDAYADEAALLEAARTITEKKGRVNRDIARAEKAGYYVKEFAFAQHVPDAVAIHQSKSVRNGRPVQGAYYLSSVEDLGGAPKHPVPVPVPCCPHHYYQYWGIFLSVPGHRQGDVQTDEQLVGYIRLRRQGASASYSVIMGHGDHLQNGIMFLLHYRLAAALLRDRPRGLRYLIYQHYTLGENDPLGNWKHRALFKPYYLHYVDDRRVLLPAEPPMPSFGEGLMALKSTLEEPWPQARQIGAELGISPTWLATLHQAWVTEAIRAPGLVTRLLRAAPTPPPDILQDLGSGLFPVQMLAGVQRVAVFLHGQDRGLDTLLPLAQANIADVCAYHSNPAELETLAATYGPQWRYELMPTDVSAINADLLVIDPPALSITSYVRDQLKPFLGNYKGAVILAINGHLLGQLKCDAEQPAVFAERLGRLLGKAVTCRKIAFRCGDPEDMFWACLDVAAAH